jgi:hypothetical protein
MPLDPAHVRAFLERDWALVQRAKDEHRRRRHAEGGAAEALRTVEALWQHARALDPGWPSAADREEDLETHRRVSEALQRTHR